MKQKFCGEYRAYRKLYRFFQIVLFPVFKWRCVGRQNIPAGPVMFCANHSSNFDPILISLAMGIEIHPHYMAKIELFRVPIVKRVLAAIGAFPVDRGRNDIASIKTAMKYLKAGEKVAIFPEGHRLNDDGGEAKRGAVRIADQMSVPVVPVYIPRNKKWFHTYTIVVGAPYLVNDVLAAELMEKITALKSQV